MKRIPLILIFILINICSSYGQGTIRGKVTDENGQPLIGATIMLKSPQPAGIVSDLDGNYTLKIPSASRQIIAVSFIGYQTYQDTLGPIKEGEVIIRNYDMAPAANEIGEVTIEARSVRGNESYMEKIKLNSGAFLDFVSTEIIKKAGDSNVTSAVSRVTGVSTFGGFVSVRGISDRYIKSTINGLRIPTLDPFTNNIKLDMFPSSLIDNIIINKTFSTDLPGDWSGAYLSIETKEYPEKLNINIETTFGYNNQSTFKNIISSEPSKTDWLGFDNGLRNIKHVEAINYEPSDLYREFAIAMDLKSSFEKLGIDETTPWKNDYTKLALVELGFLDKAYINDNEAFSLAYNQFLASDARKTGLETANSEIVKMGQSLANTWLPITRKAPLDLTQSFSIGNQTELFKKPLGFLFGFRYHTSSVYCDDSFSGRTKLRLDQEIPADNLSLQYHTFGPGKTSSEVSGWSALLNLSYKLSPNNSISFLFMPNLIGVNKARRDFLYSDLSGSPYSYYTEAQQYESRRQLVYEIKTDHFIPAWKMRIGVNAAYTSGESEAPDYKQILYEVEPVNQTITRLYWTSLQNGSFRVFRNLSEDLLDANIFAEIPFGTKSIPGKLKFGGAYQRLVRHSDQRFYYMPDDALNDKIQNGDLADYLSIDKFSAIDEDGSILRYYHQFAGPLNNTIGFSTTLSGFIMTDYAIFRELKITGGIRIEDSHQHTDILDFYDRQLAVNDNRRITDEERRYKIKPGIQDKISILPSVNIVYHLKPDNNEPVNLRFNYSRTLGRPSLRELTPFSVYDYSLLGVVTGNSELKSVDIHNFDLRGEAYFRSDNNFSVSLFYKNFTNHIELVREEFDDIYYSWQNTDKSFVKGIEVEGRIGIFKNLEFRGNATFIDSRTKLKNDSVSQTMFGQAPYILNAMMSYSSAKLGFDASANFNVQGPKLVVKSVTEDTPDIYEMPRNLIDLNFIKKLGNHFSINFKIRDLINTQQRRSYKYPSTWVDYERYAFGTTYILGISYRIQ